MLLVGLVAVFAFAFGSLLGLPLMSLGFGGLVAAAFLHAPRLLPYALAAVSLSGVAEYIAIRLESHGSAVLAQGAAILLFGRVLGPFAGAAAWEEALGAGFDPKELLQTMYARGVRLLGVVVTVVIVSLAPAS